MNLQFSKPLFENACPQQSNSFRHFTRISAHIEGLVKDCSNSSALAMELPQSCSKPSTWGMKCGVKLLIHSPKSIAFWKWVRNPIPYILYQALCWAIYKDNSDLSNMAELPSFSPPASESTLQYRTSPPRQARMRPKLKAAPVNI